MGRLKVGVVGAGTVGRAVRKLCGPEAVMFDTKPDYCHDQQAVNRCDVVFICLPTPMASDGSCDTSLVEEAISWITAPLIIIRSTVAPGTTDRLRDKYRKRVVFQPEYLGETQAHVFKRLAERDFIVLGGKIEDTALAADFYKNFYNSMVRFYFCDAITAEVAKYMENAFFAAKVTFVNEFFDIAKAFHVDFNALREVWLADSRISRDHTFVYPQARGFGGKCLPKDLHAIIRSTEEAGYMPRFLKSVLKANKEFQEKKPSECENETLDVAVCDS